MLTWNDIENHALYPTHSTAIDHCSAGAITPTQVAHLLAGGVLRDNIEVDAYDEWEGEQVGDWGYEDRYAAYQGDETLDDWQILDLFATIVNKLAEHTERLDDLVEEQADTMERVAAVESNQYFRQTPHHPGDDLLSHPARLAARLAWEQRVREGRL